MEIILIALLIPLILLGGAFVAAWREITRYQAEARRARQQLATMMEHRDIAIENAMARERELCGAGKSDADRTASWGRAAR